MAFGIPGSENSGSGGPFLGRIQYDSRVGFWKIVKRQQLPDLSWADDESEPFRNPMLLMDFGSLEVGYIRLTGQPAFLVVPYGAAIPPQPEEMTAKDEKGKARKAFLPGFRIKVYNPKIFNDNDAYYFSATAKTVMEPMDVLHQQFLAAPEAVAGKIPGVSVTGTKTIETVSSFGTSKFYAPVFEIKTWHDRPEVFGERTVAAPSSATTRVSPESRQAPQATPTNSRHVGPPSSEKADVNRGKVYAGGDDLNDAIPF